MALAAEGERQFTVEEFDLTLNRSLSESRRRKMSHGEILNANQDLTRARRYNHQDHSQLGGVGEDPSASFVLDSEAFEQARKLNSFPIREKDTQ